MECQLLQLNPTGHQRKRLEVHVRGPQLKTPALQLNGGVHGTKHAALIVPEHTMLFSSY